MSDDEIVPLLGEENAEPACNVGQYSPKRPQRSLPPGKTYHIFISCSSHDQPYVLRLKEVLEGLGFKCMLADHDFSFGVSVMRNIETTLQTSHKFLLVVSQHFLQSGMCDKEVDMAHKYAADIGQNDFMIILRLDESAMPLKLNYMTYINGVDLEVKDVGLKVEKAFDGFADVRHTQNTNGLEILRKNPTATSSNRCCGSSYELKDLSRSERNILLDCSAEETQECYWKIMEDANNRFLLKHYAVFVCGRKLTCFVLLLVLGIGTLLTSLSILLLDVNGTIITLNGLFVIFLFWTCLTIPFYMAWMACLFYKIMRRLYSIVRENTNCKSQNIFIVPRRQRNDIFISFIYYDMKPCWNFLEQRAREYWPDYTEEEIAKKCNEELVTTILSSFKGDDLNRIPIAATIRHNTYQNRCCMCLLAKSPWTYRNPALNAVPQQDMENNQNEETCVMKIAESETHHETFVKELEMNNDYFESTEENEETCVMKLFNNRQGSIFPDSHGAESVSGSNLTEADLNISMRGAEGGATLKGAEGSTTRRGAEGGITLRGAEGSTILRGAEGSTTLRGAEDGTSLTESVGGSSLDSNIYRWYGNISKTDVRGEAISLQQRQVAHELITLDTDPENLTGFEMSTSLDNLEEAVTLQSGDEELQWFHGEHFIDEETHTKVPL